MSSDLFIEFDQYLRGGFNLWPHGYLSCKTSCKYWKRGEWGQREKLVFHSALHLWMLLRFLSFNDSKKKIWNKNYTQISPQNKPCWFLKELRSKLIFCQNTNLPNQFQFSQMLIPISMVHWKPLSLLILIWQCYSDSLRFEIFPWLMPPFCDDPKFLNRSLLHSFWLVLLLLFVFYILIEKSFQDFLWWFWYFKIIKIFQDTSYLQT